MRRLVVLLAVLGACDSSPAPRPGAGRPQARADARPAASAPSTPAASVDAPPVAPEPTPLTPEATARAQTIAQTIAKRGCQADAIRELRELQRAHGDPELLVKVQQLAHRTCEDSVASAELLARTLAPDASAVERLKLGAAWLRASRYEEAVQVLEPLAASEGPASKAAWLAGFALFHAGRSKDARPLLESARAQAPKDRMDAWLLIGLCKLHDGEVDAAVAELEAGVQQVTDDPSLWSALSRAYAAAGRNDAAQRAQTRAREAHEARAVVERTQTRLSALSKALQAAANAQDVEEVERLFDRMWGDASPKVRRQMLSVRAAVYAKANLQEKAAADRARAAALPRDAEGTP